LLTNPEAIVIPDRVSPVERARRPLGVNEKIVEFLLDVFDDLVEIIVSLLPKLANTGRVVTNVVFVPGA